MIVDFKFMHDFSNRGRNSAFFGEVTTNPKLLKSLKMSSVKLSG